MSQANGDPAGLGLWPTPVQRLEEDLWVKREDLNGFGFGGTKVRAVEGVMSWALAKGASALVTGGRRDSNWVALAALAAQRYGLGFHAVLDPGDSEPTAKALMRAWGTQLYTASETGHVAVNDAISRIARRFGALAVPRGGACLWGVRGYRGLATEILAQVQDRPLDIVVALGTGGLAAGLAQALAELPAEDGGQVRVCAVPVSKSPDEALARVEQLMYAGDGPGRALALTHVSILPARHRWHPTSARVAAQAGLLLDPVFAGPAWATYVADRPADRACVLIASGGFPAIVDEAREGGS